MTSPGTRKAREREQRERRIIDAAIELAEREGWPAVTTRRLAESIEYTPPVLYGHFPEGLSAIVNAVALRGFDRLADAIEDSAGGQAPGLRRVVEAYTRFASDHPATYEAMFSMNISAKFADPHSPGPLLRAFEIFAGALPPGRDAYIRAEVLWSTLHGLCSLTRDGRIPVQGSADRVDIVIALFEDLPAATR